MVSYAENQGSDVSWEIMQAVDQHSTGSWHMGALCETFLAQDVLLRDSRYDDCDVPASAESIFTVGYVVPSGGSYGSS